MSGFLAQIEKSLNSEQLEAVKHTEGPLLILAGAGSGKTRVLTSRIAHLAFDHGVSLNEILAMTFSNKAAREMHDRVKSFLGDDSSYRYPWISTFHSISVRLLRKYGNLIGIDPNFVIYDSDDQLKIIKDACEYLDISDKAFSPKALHARISNWKNDGKRTTDILNFVNSQNDEVALSVYEKYQELLKKAGALDFDDLLMESVRLLESNDDLRLFLQMQWRYIMVDEFQDTNKIQYRMLQNMTGEHRNICVVGDDDQSIYGWRGAKIENILNFDREFNGCKVVKLEQNYRSTQNILKAAAAVISKNENRHNKTLWTEQGSGEKIHLAILEDEKKEARFIVTELLKQIRSGVSPSECAVLYRVNSLSRVFEEECLRQRLPYKIIGGFRFYERREIKDVLSYLRLILNPADTISFRRSVNTPARGVGQRSLDKIEEAAVGAPILSYLIENSENLPVTGKAKKGVHSYAQLMRTLVSDLETSTSFVDLVVKVIENSGLLESLRQERTEEARDREANLQELLSAVQEFEEQWTLETAGENSDAAERMEAESKTILSLKLADFLERVALIADTDQLGAVEAQVVFMSLHAAKGLEFDVCFIAGMEDGLFPSIRALDSPGELEEERRLCYVGITRAKKKLFLTRAESRRTFGSINFQMPSRFLREIPNEVLETTVDESAKSEVFEYSYKPRVKKPSYDEFNQDSGFDDSFSQDIGEFSYRLGDRVNHPSFGAGVVRRVEFLGEDECLTIDFSARGRKRVLSQFVQKA